MDTTDSDEDEHALNSLLARHFIAEHITGRCICTAHTYATDNRWITLADALVGGTGSRIRITTGQKMTSNANNDTDAKAWILPDGTMTTTSPIASDHAQPIDKDNFAAALAALSEARAIVEEREQSFQRKLHEKSQQLAALLPTQEELDEIQWQPATEEQSQETQRYFTTLAKIRSTCCEQNGK